MAKLLRPGEGPPDGWFFITKTGIRIEGWDLTELVSRVAEHYAWKNVPFGTREELRATIERQICSGLPPGHCRAEPGEHYQPFDDKSRDFTAESVMAASAAVLEWAKTRKFVSPEESFRRAEICRSCRFNRPSPSWVCSTLCATLTALVPEGRRENGLSICGICSCSTLAKGLAPMEVVRASNAGRDLVFPPHCWQNEEVVSTNEANPLSDSSDGTPP